MADLNKDDLDSFFKAATSLKLYSRAELIDDKDKSLIEKLYIDPLPNDQAFKTLLAESTTILIGRKGTGKSTIFQRVQQEIRKRKTNTISSYMDIRNVYESSQADSGFLDRIEEEDIALPAAEMRKLLIHNAFIRALISGVRDDLRKQVEQSFLKRLRERFSGTPHEVFEGLDRVVARLDSPNFENVVGLRKIDRKERSKSSDKATAEFSSGLEADPLKAKAKLDLKAGAEISDEAEQEFDHAEILMRIIGVNEIIRELQAVLESIGIRFLYVFLDDFSELPEDAMKAFVDAIVSPFTRWSSFIKFKIAAYPGRVYLGSLDKTKIEEFHLDLYNLYGAGDVGTMEERAIEFTQRVVTKRIEIFCKKPLYEYFENVHADFWRSLFYATMANPRILGHVMLYAYESRLIYGRRISVKTINEAAERYYDEKVATFFVAAQFRNSFHERSSAFSLKELLESIIAKARRLKDYKESATTKIIKGRTPSSHFFVSTSFDDLFTSLELAFFVTKYYEQSDRDGVRVSVYAINFGLCEKYQIGFGRPIDTREHRLYFVERIFDYNSVIRSYLEKNQEIKCVACDHIFELEMLPMLKRFRMKCPECADGVCELTNLSQKYADVLSAVNAELLLPDTELGILQTLHSEKRTMRAAEIAEDLDCSGQLVGRRAKNLAEKELITRTQSGAVKSYALTPRATNAYFADKTIGELRIPD